MLLTVPAMPQADTQFAVAMRDMQQRNFSAALHSANDALKAAPRDCRWLTVKGMALDNLGERQNALAFFQQAVNNCPRFLPALEGLAQIQYAQHSPQAAHTLETILTLRPDDETTHAMLAVLDWQKGDCQHAVEHFAKGGRQVDANPAAQTEYGFCLLQTGDTQHAEDVFQHLMEQSNSPQDRMRFAFAAWKNKDHTRALDALAPLISATAPDAMALRLAAQIAEDKGDTPDAVKWLRQAIVADPKNAEGYLIFAGISYTHQSWPVGIDMLNAGLTQLPNDARLYLARGVLRVQLSQLDLAIADFESAHRLDPKLSLAEDAIGMMQSQKHQNAAALETFRNQAMQHKDDALLQYLYAEALSQQDNTGPQQTAEAIAALRRAVAIEPDYRPAHDLLSMLYLRANDLPLAISHAERALQLDPNDDTAVYQELMAYRRLGKKEQVDALVARLKEIKQTQQNAKTKYLLQEAQP
ncbi:MAG TPA: tetratricopeptide repeat protein [Pseudacidobacterium sp.]|nr:tetratricopeptide repeat protein [Pseudacidobacterium sp.]